MSFNNESVARSFGEIKSNLKMNEQFQQQKKNNTF